MKIKHNSSIQKPKKRSRVRSFLGIKFYSAKKYLYWFLNRKSFSDIREEKTLPFIIFRHSTPLYRKLQGVEIAYQDNKIKNLKIATPKISHILIKPGKKFSYWKSIGSLTKRKGYKDGIELYYGKFRPGIGGGLCQLSNLLYWMFLHTNLKITERHKHSYDVFPDSNRKLPFGSGATCYYPFMDLEVLNDTECAYQIVLTLSESELIGEIRSDVQQKEIYEVYESENKFKTEWWGGHTRHNVIARKVSDIRGDLVKREYITENHAVCMYTPFIEGKI